MYEQIREDTLYIMLYAVVTATALIASCYLLFRQGNAFARDVTPPLRLQRATQNSHTAKGLAITANPYTSLQIKSIIQMKKTIFYKP